MREVKRILSLLVLVAALLLSATPLGCVYADESEIQQMSIDAGAYLSAAVKTDGTVAVWGNNGNGQCNVPEGLNSVKALACGRDFVVALKADGTVTSWGNNQADQCNVPEGLTDVKAVVAGDNYTVALKTDGTVVAWGNGCIGQCNIPAGLTDVNAIAAGGNYTVALRKDGTVVAWGDNSFGQCNVPVGLSNVKAISTGGNHTVALKEDGTIVIWGANWNGQCNIPAGLTDVRAVTAGESYTAILKQDGTVAVWGDNGNGQCNVPAGLSNVTAIAAGTNHMIALKRDGTVVAWGDNNCGQCNVPEGLVAAVATSSDMMLPVLSTDLQNYNPNDVVSLTVKLIGTQPSYQTNSATFEIEYDSDTFELLDNNAGSAVVNGYIPFNAKLDLGSGSLKKVHIAYMDMYGNIPLQENATVFTVRFKVKNNVTTGTKTFTLQQVDTLDPDGNVYNINDGYPMALTTEVSGDPIVQGYVSLYMGDEGTGLIDMINLNWNQASLNESFKSLNFTLKHNDQDKGTTLSGSEVFIPDTNGNLATMSPRIVTGRFRIRVQDIANVRLMIDGAGYLANSTSLSLNIGSVYEISTPITLYPGDIGKISSSKLTFSPDGKLTNADFSAWMQLYKNSMSGTVSPADRLMIDFTKDGVIDNMDFSLWFATYMKLFSIGQ